MARRTGDEQRYKGMVKMSIITLDSEEIQKLKKGKFPIVVITQRYALRLLELRTQELSAPYKTIPEFSELFERLSEISGSIEEGLAYINQYMENEGYIPVPKKRRFQVTSLSAIAESRLKEGKGAISVRDLDEFFREIGEELVQDLEYSRLSVSTGPIPLTDGRQEQLEMELNEVWDDIKDVCWKAHGILIGADFLPYELLSGERDDRNNEVNFASDVPVAAKDALDRALLVALSDWADPNQRCAAITIALALIVCPECTEIREWKKGKRVTAKFDSIEVTFPWVIKESSFLWVHAVKRGGVANESQYEWLPNLAETYEDHTRDKKCLQDLQGYFPRAKDRVSKASVLGLAWARLQRLDISESYCVTGLEESSGQFIRCSPLNLGIQLAGDNDIRKAWYPGL